MTLGWLSCIWAPCVQRNSSVLMSGDTVQLRKTVSCLSFSQAYPALRSSTKSRVLLNASALAMYAVGTDGHMTSTGRIYGKSPFADCRTC